MPVVRRHDEVPAVLGIVIAVRPQRVRRHEGPPVDRAPAGIDLVDLGMHRARERQGLDDLHQLPAADPAAASLPVGNRVEMELTTPHEVESNPRQRHAADRTVAGLVVDDLGMHRTGPGQRRQRFRRDRREGAECREELPAVDLVRRPRRS
jgi:hypothetical protein